MGRCSLRGIGALVFLLATAALLVETRPPYRSRRGMKVCSPRDVKFMATYICNLHRRSVRSVDDFEDDFESPGVSRLSGVNIPPWRPSRCGNTGRDCGPGLDSSSSLPPLARLHHHSPPAAATTITAADFNRWMSLNGYHDLSLQEDSNGLGNDLVNDPWQAIRENGETNQERENGLVRVNSATHFLGDISLAKRDREVDWPVLVPRSLSDIRRNCCLRECTAEDFYGACS
ncbi:hypothetical protein OTU49_014778 [Cherax quadricarinatus]|uniref:Uncharacterized protein n=1 Tax=Cherax quadricarinatus TaxID=27406 RepID=A0AAW0Y4L4_CHEQU